MGRVEALFLAPELIDRPQLALQPTVACGFSVAFLVQAQTKSHPGR